MQRRCSREIWDSGHRSFLGEPARDARTAAPLHDCSAMPHRSAMSRRSKIAVWNRPLARLTLMGIPKIRVTSTDDVSEIEAAHLAGDKRRAVALLMDRHGSGIYRFAMAMTRDRNLAEEIRQQVFVHAYCDLDRVAAGTPLHAWLFGVARNRCLDALRTRGRWYARFKNEAPAESEQSHGEPDRELERGRLARVLARCLAMLAPAAREAVVLRYQQELSYDEAAAIVGVQPATIRKRVTRALPVLRRCVETSRHTVVS
jgi:RNA polymerase sigma-70 factor, ECF subfamily